MPAPSTAPTVSDTVEVAAPPDAVFALLTDLDVLAELGEEVHGMRWRRGDAAAAGAVFAGTNRNGWRRWTTRCTVTDADPGHTFGFVVDLGLPGTTVSHWQYTLEPTPAGCRVTESWWDRRGRVVAAFGGLATGVADRPATNARHVAATLHRLRQRAEAA